MKTKKKVIKKVKKNKTKKVANQKTVKNELVIRVEQPQLPVVKESDLIPSKEGGKYMLTPSWLSEKMALKMLQRTDPKHIYKRKGKGGMEFIYVTGNYITKVLNFTFGWNWDFEIVAHGVAGNQVWVQGKLTVKDSKGNTITKSQFGRADIKFLKDKPKTPEHYVDFGNDLKSASTDAMKKCASMLGIASDIYGKEEYKDVGVEVQPDQPVKVIQIEEPKGKTETVYVPTSHDCHGSGKQGCPYGNDITQAEYDFSMKIYKKPLCRQCQNDLKTKGK